MIPRQKNSCYLQDLLQALCFFPLSGLLFLISVVPALASGDIPVFSNETDSAGIEHTYQGPWEYFVGGGIATFDCNQDRLSDIFVAGGESSAQLYINQSPTGGALSFRRQSPSLPARDLEKVLGAYPIDLDADGILDLVVLRVGQNLLLKGDGNCRFRKMNKHWQFDGGREWSTAFSATFEADMSYPTLAFGNYVDRSAPGSPWGTCHDNQLVRPTIPTDDDHPDRNRLAYTDRIPLRPGHCALSMLFTDWNKSGEPALRISNDRHYYRDGEEQLWRVSDGRLPRLYTRNDGWQSIKLWGMGIAEADLNGDGYPEYALTSMGDTRLQMLDDESDEDRPVYRDIAYEQGVTAHRPYVGEDFRPSTGWHAEFADFNNDTRLDLYIAKGNVEDMPDFAAFDPDNLLLGQFGGKFLEIGDRAGIALDRRGRGASIADFNADGLLDLIVVNREAPLSVFRNLGRQNNMGNSAAGQKTTGDTATRISSRGSSAADNRSRSSSATGNWLQIEVSQPGDNRFAVGATLSIKTGNLTQTRKIQVGAGHASGHAGFVHVGLGVAERAEIRILWPDQSWSAPYRVFANQFVLINRDSDKVNYWYPIPSGIKATASTGN